MNFIKYINILEDAYKVFKNKKVIINDEYDIIKLDEEFFAIYDGCIEEIMSSKPESVTDLLGLEYNELITFLDDRCYVEDDKLKFNVIEYTFYLNVRDLQNYSDYLDLVGWTKPNILSAIKRTLKERRS